MYMYIRVTRCVVCAYDMLYTSVALLWLGGILVLSFGIADSPFGSYMYMYMYADDVALIVHVYLLVD